MIFLTDTTGGLGRPMLNTILAEHLLPPSSIIISSPNPDHANLQPARDAGVKIRHGSMHDPETLITSYAGAEALFLVSYPSVGEERLHYHKVAVNAAKQAGIKHVIYTSLMFGDEQGDKSQAGVMQAHLRTAEYLKQSGMTWTIIRESPYAHLWNNFVGFLNVNNKYVKEVVMSNDGPFAWADRDELDEETAKIVANWREDINQTVNLTGPETKTGEQIVDMFTAYTGRPKIIVKKVGVEKAVEHHIGADTLPPGQKAFLPNWASWGEAMAAGEGDVVSPVLEKLLGRKPKRVEDLQHVLCSTEHELDTKDFN